MLWQSLEVSSIFSVKQEARASGRSEEERRRWRSEEGNEEDPCQSGVGDGSGRTGDGLGWPGCMRPLKSVLLK